MQVLFHSRFTASGTRLRNLHCTLRLTAAVTLDSSQSQSQCHFLHMSPSTDRVSAHLQNFQRKQYRFPGLKMHPLARLHTPLTLPSAGRPQPAPRLDSLVNSRTVREVGNVDCCMPNFNSQGGNKLPTTTRFFCFSNRFIVLSIPTRAAAHSIKFF